MQGSYDDEEEIVYLNVMNTSIIPLEVATPQTSVLVDKTITENGTYNASNDSADGYKKVVVNVSGGVTPTGTISITSNGTTDVTNYASANVNVSNSYSASDEGKVVSNGALVSQTSDTVTQNGTVDTTLINSLTVNVSGGQSMPRLVDYVELTMSSTATSSNKVSVNLTPISNYLLVVMIDTIPSPDSTYYIALQWVKGNINNTSTVQYGHILRPAGTIGTDNNQCAFNTSTGVLQLGGQYGYFLSGTKYHIYLFGYGS